MNPTAVVTGATKGLGRAIAEIFAANGFDLCVCARTERDLEAMQATWGTQFPSCRLYPFPVDLGKKSEVVEFAAFVRKTWNQLDVLVNNAGVFIPGRVSTERDGTLETMLESNLYSAYHLTRALLPLMLPHQRGHIFNIGSIAGITAHPEGGAYTISKYALHGFSRCLREEMKPQGIKVTSVLPGATWSDSWRGVELPRERLMEPDDVAKMVWAAYSLSPTAVVEDLVIRPQLGDL